MKNLIILCCLIHVTNHCKSQHINELTNKVVEIFNRSHPLVKTVDWMLTDSNLIAVYKDKGRSVEKTYDKSGKIIRTKLEIDASFLPKSSSDFMAKFYGSTNAFKAFKFFDDSSKISYFIELDSTKLSFDNYGNFLNYELIKKLK